MRRLIGTPRTPRGLRTAGIFSGIVAAYFLLRSITPIGAAFGVIEHGFVVVGTGVGNAIGRITRSEASTSALLAACQEQLQSAAVKETMLREDAKSVTELEELVGYVRESGAKGVAARVIARSLPDAATLTIDKGSHDGIIEGSAVVVADGHLLGVVTEVSDGAAEVRLVHNKLSRIPAAILGNTRTIGLIEGQEGSLLRMQFVPEDAVIRQGDLVATSGLEGEVPQNIVIGVITSVIDKDTAPFLEALVEPLYDARTWTNVFVLTPAA